MNNENFKKLLKEYKQTVIKENYNESHFIYTLVKDAKDTVDMWLSVDTDSFIESDKNTQYTLVKDSLDDYIEDVYDDIENELPEDINVDKWLKKNKKKIITDIVKEINK